MPVTIGAKKKLRQDKKRQKFNLLTKKKAREVIKKYKLQPDKKKLADVYSILDSLSKKKIYHANKVARLKSRLSKLLGKKTSVSKPAIKTSTKVKSPRKKKTVV